jgi:hypothetical protein
LIFWVYWKLPRWFAALLRREGLLILVEMLLFPDIEFILRRCGQPGQQLIQGQSLYPTLETAGPNHIEVQQFGGFGPMGTAALGDW